AYLASVNVDPETGEILEDQAEDNLDDALPPEVSETSTPVFEPEILAYETSPQNDPLPVEPTIYLEDYDSPIPNMRE
ncbi:hypothetical protein SHY67_11525, partial [Streptococcus suis]